MAISNTGKAVLVWGLMALIGWGAIGLSILAKVPFDFGIGFFASSLLWWSVLILIAFVATYQWIPGKPWKNKTVQVWVGIVIIGMLENYLNFAGFIPAPLNQYSYFHLWLLLTGIGFFLTIKTWGGDSVPYYAAAGVLNVGLLILMLLQIDFVVQNNLLLAGIVQGIPTIADALQNYKA